MHVRKPQHQRAAAHDQLQLQGVALGRECGGQGRHRDHGSVDRAGDVSLYCQGDAGGGVRGCSPLCWPGLVHRAIVVPRPCCRLTPTGRSGRFTLSGVFK